MIHTKTTRYILKIGPSEGTNSRLMLGVIIFAEGITRLALSDPQHWKRKHLASLIINFALHELD